MSVCSYAMICCKKHRQCTANDYFPRWWGSSSTSFRMICLLTVHWFVIVHLLVGIPWVSWLLDDGLYLVFHLLSRQAHQICIILVFQLARLLNSVLPSRQMPHLLHPLHHAEASALLHPLTRWGMQISEGDWFSIYASYRSMWTRGDSEHHCLVCYYKP